MEQDRQARLVLPDFKALQVVLELLGQLVQQAQQVRLEVQAQQEQLDQLDRQVRKVLEGVQALQELLGRPVVQVERVE